LGVSAGLARSIAGVPSDVSGTARPSASSAIRWRAVLLTAATVSPAWPQRDIAGRGRSPP
jgi:hypothetical protein